MWVSYYNQKCTSAEAISAFDGSGDTVPNRPVPKNVRFVAGPSGSLDFEDTLQEVRLFSRCMGFYQTD